MEENLECENRKGKVLYIIEAALEYFISLIVAGAYLAKVTSAIGMSQGLTGILTSFISLGAVFQIFALFFAGKRRPKRFVTLIHTLNQLCFVFLYLIPLISIPDVVKHVFFAVFLLVGYLLFNLVSSPKIAWGMLFVGEEERGRYTAKKEIYSLISGMIFSYLVSFVIDYFEEKGELNVAFIISAISIFILMIAHTFTLLKMPERELPVQNEKITFTASLKTVFGNSSVRKVLVVATLYQVANCMVYSFYGTYATNESSQFGLGFTMSFIAIVSILYSIVRACVSQPMGRLADRYSFKTVSILCYGLLAVSFLFGAFMIPSNGKVFYTLFFIVYAIAQSGINSGIINLLYEEVEPAQRMSAYAVQQAFAGLVGFLSAIVAGIFVDAVHENGGKLLGLYAQQWLSVWGVVISLMIVAFIYFVMKKKDR